MVQCNITKSSMKQSQKQHEATPLLAADCCPPVLPLCPSLYRSSAQLQLATTCIDAASLIGSGITCWNTSHNHLGNTSITPRTLRIIMCDYYVMIFERVIPNVTIWVCFLLSEWPWGNLTGVLISLSAGGSASLFSWLWSCIDSREARLSAGPECLCARAWITRSDVVQRKLFLLLADSLRPRTHTHTQSIFEPYSSEDTLVYLWCWSAGIKGQQLFGDAICFTCITVGTELEGWHFDTMWDFVNCQV